jgi:2-dehydro-3-deoxyphosphogluconate aldolase/(4S)-4-hydroxy-2-oxoglutarate aldolase
MNVVELTCSTPDVETAIAQLVDDGLVVGLGTVTSPDRIGPAVSAGASFIVSFCAPAGLIGAAHRSGVLAIPGAMSPSEVALCRRAGADAVKIFPAGELTPGYVRHLSAVMPGLRLLATGGIAPCGDALRPWLAAGAIAVGIGGGLGTVSQVGDDQVQRRARDALAAAGVKPPA